MKKRVLIPTLAVLLFTSTASLPAQAGAQAYQPYPYTAPSYAPVSTDCVALAQDLSFGTRGDEVLKLQKFLVAQNYPGGGNWMLTGYFGQATVQAVRNFQQSAGLPMTGSLDPATRSAIQARSCGGLGGLPIVPPVTYQSTPAYMYPSYPSYPTYPTTPTPTYPYLGNVSIASLSTPSAQVGTSITIYGNGFDAYANTVHVGTVTTSAYGSATSLTFTVPSIAAGTYSVYVTNSRGTSNSVSLTVGPTPSACPPQQYSWQWWNQPCGIYSNVTLDNLTPNWTGVGSTVTVKGTGFSPAGNTVYMGESVVGVAVSSSNGTSLTFTVPTQIQTSYGLQQVMPGHYPIRVVNATGASSNTLTLSITMQGSSSLSIASVSGPTSLATGAQGTWTIVVNAPYGSYLTTAVGWGDGSTPYVPVIPASYVAGLQQTLTFTHVYNNAGTYTVTFTVSSSSGGNPVTTTKTVTVTSTGGGGGGTGQLNLSSLSPMQGTIGTTVTLTGSGFSASNNVVHFGIGGARNVVSMNSGTQIAYVIPTHISACDLIEPGYFCGAPVQTVTPGVYPMYVTNATGATNILYFTVQ